MEARKEATALGLFGSNEHQPSEEDFLELLSLIHQSNIISAHGISAHYPAPPVEVGPPAADNGGGGMGAADTLGAQPTLLSQGAQSVGNDAAPAEMVGDDDPMGIEETFHIPDDL